MDICLFLGQLNTIFLNILNSLSHIKVTTGFIQSIVLTNFVIILNVSMMKEVDCSWLPTRPDIYEPTEH